MPTTQETLDPARRLWALVEHLHAVTYFAPEARAAYEDAGIRGFWRGYFAGRAAPMGRVGAGVVEATFFGFHHEMVARALPSVWELASPETAISARAAGAAAALEGLLGSTPSDVVEEAADLLDQGARAAAPAGRPLFAANLDLDPPTERWARLWHGTTLWREHRGDGHVAALVLAGLDGCEAHVLRLAEEGVGSAQMRAARGWSDDDWAAAKTRLVERGLLDPDGRATAAGLALRGEVEAGTDRAAAAPVEVLGAAGTARLEELLAPLAVAVGEAGQMPHPNPIGVGPVS